MSSTEHVEAIIYRWQDGSTVTCVVGDPLSGLGDLYFEICSPGEPKVELWLNGSTLFGEGPVDRSTSKKVLGFFLDLGASRPFLSSNLGLQLQAVSLQIPVYVPNDLWANRFDQALQILRSKRTGDLLLWEVDIYIKEEDDGGGEDDDEEDEEEDRDGDADWDHDRSSVFLTGLDEASFGFDFEGGSVEEVVDDFTFDQLILPESGRESWETENVERGSWVLPTPEEVEVYRALGEQLPFWWELEKLEAWLRERT